ncbi:U32 family peptidase [Micromonospora cathayae]|uniref:U32 family peptidase n=1 Tax=Micromonospora cathayae TaxID=3028804 RepID=A0ABY7ZLQ7_9ACTN|nr:U32 family peptidase [Micromonospora sp. HUAS 3]WDZ82839.1 U32 family peptidase [Micromonospora sp. HUAS 3]
MSADPRAGQPCAPRTDLPGRAPSLPGRAGQVAPDRAGQVALNAPVRSLKMLELQIAAGATEVYLGLLPPADVPVSFDALPARRDGEPTHVSSPALLAELVTAAHTAGLRVHFCADAPVVDPAHTTAWLGHVGQGLAAGADTVVVGNLAGCARLADRDDVTLVAGSPMGVSTVAYAAHLRDAYRVRRVVLPHTLTLAEVAAFCALDDLEIETPVQTGAGLDCTRCRLPDTPGIGLGCRAGWTGGQDGDPTGESAGGPAGGTAVDLGGFLDGASDCALCDVPALVEIGVRALQIPGRESPNLRQNAKITQMYRRAVRGHATGTPMPEVIAAIDRVELMWQMGWLPRFCDQQRCRFRDTPQQRAYV